MLIKLNEQFLRKNNLSLPQKGIVVDNRDPKGLGRVKATVGGILEGDRVKLPWIMPWAGVGQGGSAGQSTPNIPELGDVIVVEFKFGSIYSGFYTGHWGSNITRSGLGNEDYPNTEVKADKSGNVEITNKTKRTWEKTFASGASIQVDAEGNMTFVTKGKITFQSEDGETINEFDMQSGKQSNKSGEVTEVTGRSVQINSQELSVNVDGLSETIKGARTTQVDGSLINTIGGSHSNVVAGNSSEVVSGTTENLYTLKAKNTYGAGLEENYVLGDIVKNLIAGNVSFNLTLGNESHSIASGNYSVNIASGNIVLQTLVGSVSISAAAGSIAIDQTGAINISASSYSVNSLAAMNLTAGATLSINAPLTQFNGGVGQVLTNITSPVVDTITGIPTIGVPVVLA